MINYNKVIAISFFQFQRSVLVLGGKCPGGKCPGGICPRGYMS